MSDAHDLRASIKASGNGDHLARSADGCIQYGRAAKQGKLTQGVVACLLLLHALLLGWGASTHAPTIDEVAYLPAGLWHWKTGQFGLASVSPPLVRRLAAIPLVWGMPKTDWSQVRSGPGERSEHAVGAAFLRANGEGSFDYFKWARWICIPLSLLGGYICYRWARDLYGEPAGFVALILWCFSPNLLAHGQLVTPDMGVTALGIAAGYTFWRWLRIPNWPHALTSGIVLGFSELAKTTVLVFFVVWPILWLLFRWTTRHASATTPLGTGVLQLGSILLLAVGVLNAGYEFSGSFRPLRDYVFVSQLLTNAPENGATARLPGNRFAGHWSGRLLVPLPDDYLQGIDLQRLDFERGRQSYAWGVWSDRGWWWYYLYALALKVPLGTWILFALAAGLSVCCQRYVPAWRDEMVLVLPGLALFVLVSSQTGFSNHLRYMLPALPFGIVWLSKVAQAWRFRDRPIRIVVAVALSWTLLSSLSIFPHSLSYFNELAGGPMQGDAHLVDSNIDWGQDLFYLKKWLEAHPATGRIGLAYFGPCDPRLAGIDFELPPRLPEAPLPTSSPNGESPEWCAISVNLLRGYRFAPFAGNGERQSLDEGSYEPYLRCHPAGRAGYSINIYRLPDNEPAVVGR